MMLSVLVCNILHPLLPLILPCVLIALALKLWNIYNENTRDTRCAAPLPEGSMGLPFIGETIQFIIQGVDFYRKKYLRHGPIFKTHIIGKPTIRVIGIENVSTILQGDGEIVEPYYPATFRTIIASQSQSILFSTGVEHERIRKLTSKVFNHSQLSASVPYIQKYTDEAITRWCLNGVVSGQDECHALLFRIASKVMCNFDYDEMETKHLSRVYKTMIDNMFCLPIDLPGTGFNKAMKARGIILSKIEANLKHRKEATNTDLDFVDALSLLAQEYDENAGAVNSQCLTGFALELLFAGHTSSATAASMMLLYLAKHPDVVTKVREELQEFQLLDRGEPLTLDAVSNLRYLDCVVKEVLRIAPPVGAGFRKVIKTFELAGKQIPVGWTLIYSIRETQNLAPNYCKPEEFDPDRFLPSRQEDKKGGRFSFLPFGAGPRGCIGKQLAKLMLKVVLIELVKSCRWELASPASLSLKLLPMPHAADGLPLRFAELDCNANGLDVDSKKPMP
ncbi:cytochrome P450 26B1-like [Ptychodera flava]|uniref:cytochrome P450 26B1-like n=1 Tax=Ptychodera flava TaxID=63121 RepID=UPI00396A4FEB